MTDTAYLERALIGSLLLHPERLHLAAGLTGRDFTDPLCHALWATLHDTAWPAGPANCADVADVLQRSQPDIHTNLRTPAAVAELAVHAPAASNIHTYAELIADATTRRDVISLGYQLTQIAPRADNARERVEDIRQQLIQAANRHAWIDVPEADRPSCSRLQRSGEVPLDRHPRLGRDQVVAEYAVVGAAIHDNPPGSRQEARTCVRVDQLQTPRLRAVWHAIGALESAGLAVDEITVHWQLRSSAAHPLPGIQELRDLAGWTIHLTAAIAYLRETRSQHQMDVLGRTLKQANRSERPATASLLWATAAAARDAAPARPRARPLPSH